VTVRRWVAVGASCALVFLTGAAGAAPAFAAAEAAAWRLEQPLPPAPPSGVQGSQVPIGLGKIGDIEFWAPNRGLLITGGNPPTIPPGLWAYNGVEWHELATVCGAETEGRIAWAGPEEFWTVSDGRPGQTSRSAETIERSPVLADNTLCRFSGGAVVASYARPSFQADSYQPMHAAACMSPSDCWFAGDPLEEPAVGAFQLHWNGAALEGEPYPAEGHAVEDMRLAGGHLYESTRLAPGDRVTVSQPEPPVVRRINPEGVLPIFEPEAELPLYGSTELPAALDYLRLSAADGALWAATGPKREPGSETEGHEQGRVTVVRRFEGSWSQLIGPAHPLGSSLFPAEAELFPNGIELPSGAEHAAVASIAAEPGSGSAWLALAPQEPPSAAQEAAVVRVSAEGKVLEAQTVPSARERSEGVGPKGSAAKIACPAANDCWLATMEGWLFHLAPESERRLAADTDPAFAGPVTYRPPDQGLPQVVADAPPPDNSGLVEAPPVLEAVKTPPPSAEKLQVAMPLLSHLHSRLVHGSTLELRFDLAVKARIRLLAERHGRVVASTPVRTLAGGRRSLLLRLDPRRWPTKLDLRTHALARLPTVPAAGEGAGGGSGTGGGSNTVTTGFAVLPRVPWPAGSEPLP
jgi:hypothetical protein